MNVSDFGEWPVVRQITKKDAKALGKTAYSDRIKSLQPRTRGVDKIARSICPYCAVGCGQLIYVKDNKIVNIEGDPESPVSEGCLCPKGSATFQLVTSQQRTLTVQYRKPHGTEWETIPLQQAMEMIAQRVKATRDSAWEASSEDGKPLNRTLSIAHLGGATLDNEENYLIKKLFSSLGIIQIENQARI